MTNEPLLKINNQAGNSHVHVIGITGDWLQVKLPGDKVGFIPTRAAE